MEEILAERDSTPSASSTLPKKGDAFKVLKVSSNLPSTKQTSPDASTIFSTKFQAPNSSSASVSCFVRMIKTDIFETSYKLFVPKNDPRYILNSTDGCCVSNGGLAAKAGCAFVWYPGGATDRLFDDRHYFRLENWGPNGAYSEPPGCVW